ncbi:MAG TPA: hypothetical protein PLF40_12485 [Kofleriaceae bacterium]|nr:hypothetical protein [Kofleriaceae bacterium]
MQYAKLGVALLACSIAATACHPSGALHPAGATAPAIILYQDGVVLDGQLAFMTSTPPWLTRYDIALHSRAEASGLRSIVTVHNPTNAPWRGAVVQLAATPVPAALRPASAMDQDADRIPDLEDICSEDDEGPGAGPAEDCPETAAIFTGSQLGPLLSRVMFSGKNSATLPPSPQALIDVATLLQQTPDIQRLEVGVHAVAGERIDIAVQRLWAVLALLQARGVAAERLVPLLYTDPVREPIGWVAFRMLQTRRQWRSVARNYDPRHDLARSPTAAPVAPMRVTLPKLVDVAAGARREFMLLEVPLDVEVVNWWQPSTAAPQRAGAVPALLVHNPNLSTISAGPATLRRNREVINNARLEALAPQTTQVVPLSVSPNAASQPPVQTTVQHDEVPLRMVAVHDGVVQLERAMRRRTSYTIDDVALMPNRVLVAHPRSQRYHVADVTPAAIDLGAVLAVPLTATARTQAVDERTVFVYEYALDAADLALAPYVANSNLNAAAKRDLRVMEELREQVRVAQHALQSLVLATPLNPSERKALQQTLMARSQRYFETTAALRRAAHAFNMAP